MPKPIVVGVDGSLASLRAVTLARQLAHAAELDTRLIHAVPDAWQPLEIGGPPLMTEELAARVEIESRARVVRMLETEVPVQLAESLEVKRGRPGPVLARAADESNAALVAIGGKPHGPFARAFGGSTAHYLLHVLGIPLFVAGAAAERVRNVLVAVDLSYASGPTLAAARRLAEWLRAQLRVLHVVEPPVIPVEAPLTIDVEDLMRRSRTAYDELVTSQLSLTAENRVIREGAAAEIIVREAAEFGADLVVLGSHGKGWVDRLLVGSVTERLLTALPTSLLVVPVSPKKRRTARRPALDLAAATAE